LRTSQNIDQVSAKIIASAAGFSLPEVKTLIASEVATMSEAAAA
jgi:hypothetical protein